MKKIFSTLSLLLAVAMLGGCAQKVLTPEEIAAERERQLRMITRVYPDKTVQDVLLAADRVFRLADDDYVVSHSPTGLQAQRRWFIYLIISVTFGTDTWMVTTEPLPQGGVKVVAMHSGEASAVTGIVTTNSNGGTSTSALTSPAMQNMTTSPAIYELFFARLDYFLDQRKDWVTCRDAKKLFTDGLLDPFCTVANDRTPDGLSAAQRREKEEKEHPAPGEKWSE